MRMNINTPEGLSTCAGAGLLLATTHATILHSGGYWTANAPMIAAMSFGIFAGARALGASPKKTLGILGACIIAALLAGEAYNFQATAEMTVANRLDAAEPLQAKKNARAAALANLEKLENGGPTSARVQAAQSALADAKVATGSQRVAVAQRELDKATKALDAKCLRNCEVRKVTAAKARADLNKALVDDVADRKAAIAAAEAELRDAIKEAKDGHAAALEKARADVKANPEPRSPAPLADNIGWAPWALDLLAAFLRSVGCNGLAATLIAFGARRMPDPAGQSDYSAPEGIDPALVRFLRPDYPRIVPDGPTQAPDGPANDPDGPKGGNANPPKGGPDGPKKPGGSGKPISKEKALGNVVRLIGKGKTIPSQAHCARMWNRPVTTVSDWFTEWRSIGVIPAATTAGRCKATLPVE